MGWARFGLGFRLGFGLGFRLGAATRVRAEVKKRARARFGWGAVTLLKSTRELRVSICSAKELIELTVSLSVLSSAWETRTVSQLVRM